jgi:hypothetical protein
LRYAALSKQASGNTCGVADQAAKLEHVPLMMDALDELQHKGVVGRGGLGRGQGN